MTQSTCSRFGSSSVASSSLLQRLPERQTKKAKQVINLLGCSDMQAVELLERRAWDVNAAVDLYFSSPSCSSCAPFASLIPPSFSSISSSSSVHTAIPPDLSASSSHRSQPCPITSSRCPPSSLSSSHKEATEPSLSAAPSSSECNHSASQSARRGPCRLLDELEVTQADPRKLSSSIPSQRAGAHGSNHHSTQFTEPTMGEDSEHMPSSFDSVAGTRASPAHARPLDRNASRSSLYDKTKSRHSSMCTHWRQQGSSPTEQPYQKEEDGREEKRAAENQVRSTRDTGSAGTAKVFPAERSQRGACTATTSSTERGPVVICIDDDDDENNSSECSKRERNLPCGLPASRHRRNGADVAHRTETVRRSHRSQSDPAAAAASAAAAVASDVPVCYSSSRSTDAQMQRSASAVYESAISTNLSSSNSESRGRKENKRCESRSNSSDSSSRNVVGDNSSERSRNSSVSNNRADIMSESDSQFTEDSASWRKRGAMTETSKETKKLCNKSGAEADESVSFRRSLSRSALSSPPQPLATTTTSREGPGGRGGAEAAATVTAKEAAERVTRELERRRAWRKRDIAAGKEVLSTQGVSSDWEAYLGRITVEVTIVTAAVARHAAYLPLSFVGDVRVPVKPPPNAQKNNLLSLFPQRRAPPPPKLYRIDPSAAEVREEAHRLLYPQIHLHHRQKQRQQHHKSPQLQQTTEMSTSNRQLPPLPELIEAINENSCSLRVVIGDREGGRVQRSLSKDLLVLLLLGLVRVVPQWTEPLTWPLRVGSSLTVGVSLFLTSSIFRLEAARGGLGLAATEKCCAAVRALCEAACVPIRGHADAEEEEGGDAKQSTSVCVSVKDEKQQLRVQQQIQQQYLRQQQNQCNQREQQDIKLEGTAADVDATAARTEEGGTRPQKERLPSMTTVKLLLKEEKKVGLICMEKTTEGKEESLNELGTTQGQTNTSHDPVAGSALSAEKNFDDEDDDEEEEGEEEKEDEDDEEQHASLSDLVLGECHDLKSESSLGEGVDGISSSMLTGAVGGTASAVSRGASGGEKVTITASAGVSCVSSSTRKPQLPRMQPSFAVFRTTLRPYQQQGLAWMRQRETDTYIRVSDSNRVEAADNKKNKHSSEPTLRELHPSWRRIELPDASTTAAAATAVAHEPWVHDSRIEDAGRAGAGGGGRLRDGRKGSDKKQHCIYLYVNWSACAFSLSFPVVSKSLKGGLLADAMGLGKTVQLLALVASDLCPPKFVAESSSDANKEEGQKCADFHHFSSASDDGWGVTREPHHTKATASSASYESSPSFVDERDTGIQGGDKNGDSSMGKASYADTKLSPFPTETTSPGEAGRDVVKPVEAASTAVTATSVGDSSTSNIPKADLLSICSESPTPSPPLASSFSGPSSCVSGSCSSDASLSSIASTAPPTAHDAASCASAHTALQAAEPLFLQRYMKREKEDGKYTGGTLIVVPLSLLSQWREELLLHLQPGICSTYEYYGPARVRDPSFIAAHSVVLTTYQTLATDYRSYLRSGFMGRTRKASASPSGKIREAQSVTNRKTSEEQGEVAAKRAGDDKGNKARGWGKRRRPDGNEEEEAGILGRDIRLRKKDETDCLSPLHEICFYRVVLDEGHIVKCASSLQCRACCALHAERRWILTGTPLQNDISDTFALIKFLHLLPFGTPSWWAENVTQPAEKGLTSQAIVAVRNVLLPLMLRRHAHTRDETGRQILPLPPITFHCFNICLTKYERSLYMQYFLRSREEFESLVNSGLVMTQYSHVLLLLLRLRQLCCHPALLTARSAAPAALLAAAAEGKVNVQKVVGSLLKQSTSGTSSDYVNGVVQRFLQEKKIEECPICCDFPPEPVLLTTCCHTLCYACALLLLNRKRNFCPLCRISFTFKDIQAIPLPAAVAAASVFSLSSAFPTTGLPPTRGGAASEAVAGVPTVTGLSTSASVSSHDSGVRAAGGADASRCIAAAPPATCVCSTETADLELAAAGETGNTKVQQEDATALTGNVIKAKLSQVESGTLKAAAVSESSTVGPQAIQAASQQTALVPSSRTLDGSHPAAAGAAEAAPTSPGSECASAGEGEKAETARRDGSSLPATSAGSDSLIKAGRASACVSDSASICTSSVPMDESSTAALHNATNNTPSQCSEEKEIISAKTANAEVPFFFSTKMKTAIALLVEDVRRGLYCVVFSQWTSMLDKMEEGFAAYERQNAAAAETALAEAKAVASHVDGEGGAGGGGEEKGLTARRARTTRFQEETGNVFFGEKSRMVSTTTRGRLLPYRRLDGSMSSKQRQEVLRWFCKRRTPEEVDPSRIIEEDEHGVNAGLSVPPQQRPGMRFFDKTRNLQRKNSLLSPFAGVFSEQHRLAHDSVPTSTKYGKDLESNSARCSRGSVDATASAAGEGRGEECERGCILLCSLKAGNVGLNLTRATRCYLMDGWWNPHVEHQAMRRIWRYGQDKPVHIIRFVCLRTVEERLEELKEFKGWMAHGACETEGSLGYYESVKSQVALGEKGRDFAESQRAYERARLTSIAAGKSDNDRDTKTLVSSPSYSRGDTSCMSACIGSTTYRSGYGAGYGGDLGHSPTPGSHGIHQFSYEENRQRGKLTLEDLKRIFAGFENEQHEAAEFYVNRKYPGPGLEFEGTEGRCKSAREKLMV